MALVDTNVLVYAAHGEAPEHHACRRLLERLASDRFPWFTTWPILYEFLRVVTHPRVFRSPASASEAWSFLEPLLASPGLQILVQTDRHEDVAAGTVQEISGLRGNLFHDAHTAVLMREHGVRRIYTRDTDFHRFSFLEVLDPLVEPGE